MNKLYIIGFPGMYGGAGTELHHQIRAWSTMDIDLHIIPTNSGFMSEPLYGEMVKMGVKIHEPRDYSPVRDDAVINFCSSEFLDDLEVINKHTNKVMWVNCMTFLFDTEKRKAKDGLISHYLYQREEVMEDHNYRMRILGRPKCQTMVFKPYFDPSSLEFSVKSSQETNIGRISRQDLDKFSPDTLHIYEYIVSPKFKRGHFLGYKPEVASKIGQPFDWITTYSSHTDLPVKDFYGMVDFIVQSTDTTENLPRIGFEAMLSGCPLVVNNRGGWKHMIEHGVSGFLCDHSRDFIYYGSRLAYDEDLKDRIATNAYGRAKEMSSLEQSVESWREVFESVY